MARCCVEDVVDVCVMAVVVDEVELEVVDVDVSAQPDLALKKKHMCAPSGCTSCTSFGACGCSRCEP